MTRLFVLVMLVWLSACQQDQESVRDVSGNWDRKAMPAKLSQWHLFRIEDDSLVPNEQTLPYDLNSPLFTDYAHKFRTVHVPEGTQIQVEEEGRLSFPVGSVVSKTFYYPTSGEQFLKTASEAMDFAEQGLNLKKVRLVETRLMVKYQDGWRGLPYVWDEDGLDATLTLTGAVKSFRLNDEHGKTQAFEYIVPDFNQCQGCHIENLTEGGMALLGFKPRHIDKPYDHLSTTGNQIQRFVDRGWLDALPGHALTNVDFSDEALPIEARARSYLDINCSHCHNPSGAADTSGMFLNAAVTEPLRLGVCKPPIAAGQGTGGHKYGITPGDGEDSIIVYRMKSLDPGAMMPELGRSLAHDEGIALITHWINQMDGDC